MRVIGPPVWDPSARRRARWRAIANDEANAAERADELYVARAFRAIVKLLDADALPLEDVPRTHHGRKLVRAEALRLARTGLNGAEIARVLDEPRFTIARWLRVAGMNRRPDDYERAAFAQRASRRIGIAHNSRPAALRCSNWGGYRRSGRRGQALIHAQMRRPRTTTDTTART